MLSSASHAARASVELCCVYIRYTGSLLLCIVVVATVVVAANVVVVVNDKYQI